ncbi:MAG: S8 family serine peptidase [Lachnospiraceae bacterium]|nr:S8 family serine peptidase [Lachnospiraceae bacterium]
MKRPFVKKIVCLILIVFLAATVLLPLFSLAAEYGDLTPEQWAYTAPYGMQVPGWNSGSGNMKDEVIVAVVDGFVDYTHPDLKDVIYEFSEEEQQALGCGRYGYDATKKDNSEPSADDHATHVAGIIAGSWNGSGISGVGSKIKIISVCCSVGEDTPLDYCLEAYAFLLRALEYGIPIRVINNSWGNVDSSLAMNSLIEACGELGALSVFSAGNYDDDLEDTMFLPAGYMHNSPFAVVVGSHTDSGSKSPFSSYGETVMDIFAPGSDILSAMSSSYPESYEYMNGTSMACPAVSGAAAYLAGNHGELSDTPSLRRQLLACAKPLDATNVFFANGILDLSVDETGNYAPVIEALSATAHSVTAEGAFFGPDQGTILVLDATGTGGDEPIDVQITDWSDNKITVAANGKLPAVCKVYVESAENAKFDSALLFTGKSEDVFEEDLVLPDDYGAPDLIDSAPDYQAAGWMGGMDGCLYYLPLFFLVEDVVLATDRLYRFDYREGTWETLAALPEAVVSTQAAVIDHRIVLTGVNRSLTESVAYRYDPETDEWEKLPSDEIPLYASVVNRDGSLLLVGGVDSPDKTDAPLDTILSYDPETGTCTEEGYLAQGVWGAQAVYVDETLYVYGHVTDANGINRQHFQRISGVEAVLLDDAFPSFRPGEGNRRPKFNVAMHGALVACKEGLILTGPLADDGSADTYLLRDGEDVFEPFRKRLSDAPVFWPAACAYDGKLFTIGRSMAEPGFALFRATPVETFETYVPPPEEPDEEEPAEETDTPAEEAPVENEPVEEAPAEPPSAESETVQRPSASGPAPYIIVIGAIVLSVPAWLFLRRRR